MKIRRYLGRNAQEAILKVKMDMGNDALILNTRKVRQKGIFKLFSKPMVEVLAAVDDNHAGNPERKIIDNTARDAAASASGNGEKSAKENKDGKFFGEKDGEKDDKICYLENKVKGMENMLRKIYDQLFLTGNAQNNLSKKENNGEGSKILQAFYNNLLKNEVEHEIARRIIDMVNERLKGRIDVNEAALTLSNLVAGMLGKPEIIRIREDKKPTVVVFIGPTGVGKTTTIAKIAANYVLNHQKKIGFITADTYRIAAVEQLKTYADILDIPVAVVYSPDEMRDAVSQHSDKDVVLIDTAGRSHRNNSQLEELKTIVNISNADEVYLVLSATTSMRNCREILRNYDFLKEYKLIFTKLDEAPVAGIILNARYLTGKNLSYITTGQSVPDDIEVVDVGKLVKNILGSMA